MRDLIRRLTLPLQALAALVICLGMFWMIMVVANVNPDPPTALDIQMRSTNDDSFASMNSTAAALAFDLIGDTMPSPIVMPVTGNSTPTPSPAPTIAVTLRVVTFGTETSTPSSLFSFFFEPTRTREPRIDPPTFTATQVPTKTPIPTSTPTRVPTRTPTATRTSIPVPTLPVILTDTPTPVTTTEVTPNHTAETPESTPLQPPPTATEMTVSPTETLAPLNSPEPVETDNEAALYP